MRRKKSFYNHTAILLCFGIAILFFLIFYNIRWTAMPCVAELICVDESLDF